MKNGWLKAVCALAVVGAAAVSMRAADKGVTLIGTGLIAGDALDKSGLATQPICRFEDSAVCIDQATFGGFGSALAYTGFDNVFLAVPDRGPFDGRTDVPYQDRFHFMHITVDRTAAFPNIRSVLLNTRMMVAPGNEDLVGR